MRYILNILRRHSLDRTTSIFLRTSTAGLHCVTAQISCSGWTFSCCQYKTITCSFCSEHSEEKRRCSDCINVTAWRRETEWKSVTLVFVSESEYYNHDNNNNEYWNVVPRVVSTREDFSSCVWRVELVWAATCPEWLFFFCISDTFLPFCYLNWVLWERRCYSLLLHHLCVCLCWGLVTTQSLSGSFVFSFCRQAAFVVVII